MKRGIKFIIMFRLTVIVILVFVSYTALILLFFGSLGQNNIINYGLNGSYKNQIVLETALTELFRFSDTVSNDKDIQGFLSTERFSSSAQRTKAIYDLMNTLKDKLSYSDYIHSFCIVSNDNGAYWNVHPYDNYYYDFMTNYVLKEQSLNEQLGFTAPFYFPDSGFMYQPINLIGYVTNINHIEDGAVKTLGQVIINFDLKALSNDLATGETMFSQTGILSPKGELIYLSSGDEKEFVDVAFDLTQSFNATQSGFYFVNHIETTDWQLVSRWQENQPSLQRETAILWVLGGVVVLIMALIFAFVFPVLLNVSKQITVLQQAIARVGEGDLDVSIELYGSKELVRISNGFNSMIASTKQHMNNSLKNLEEKQKVSFELLLAKINPHFIYNTLNSIVYLAKKNKNDDIIRLTTSFVALLQDSVQFDNSSLFDTVEVETNIVERYVTIQKIRYANRFMYKSDVPKSLNGVLIPKNILQPLIENAILHGACADDGTKDVLLDIKQSGNNLVIKIIDTGVGMSQDKIQEILHTNRGHSATGSSKMRPIGISNIMDKLCHIYKESYSFAISSVLGEYTEVNIILPINHQ